MFVEFNWIEAMTASPILLILVGCSVITVGVALERYLYFRKRAGDADATLTKALTKVREGQVKEAAWLCRSNPHPMGVVAAEVIDSLGQKLAEVEERIQIVLSQQKLLLEKNIGILGTMAAVAPLIGLLGTVWGIMRAFHDMALTGSAAPSVVAAGVAEALVTTAAGLIIAVPAVLLFNHFNRRMNVMLTIAENHARSLRTAAYEKPSEKDRHSNTQWLEEELAIPKPDSVDAIKNEEPVGTAAI
jgi:biopolymer transport protein ExbB